jgi:hypothetical protein
MQMANFSWEAIIWLLCALLTGLATASDLQSSEAAWYAGEFGARSVRGTAAAGGQGDPTSPTWSRCGPA